MSGVTAAETVAAVVLVLVLVLVGPWTGAAGVLAVMATPHTIDLCRRTLLAVVVRRGRGRGRGRERARGRASSLHRLVQEEEW